MKGKEGVRSCACPPLPAVTFRLLCPSLGASEALLLEGGWGEEQKKGMGGVVVVGGFISHEFTHGRHCAELASR